MNYYSCLALEGRTGDNCFCFHCQMQSQKRHLQPQDLSHWSSVSALLLAADRIQRIAASEEKKKKRAGGGREKEAFFQIIHNLKKMPVPERFCKTLQDEVYVLHPNKGPRKCEFIGTVMAYCCPFIAMCLWRTDPSENVSYLAGSTGDKQLVKGLRLLPTSQYFQNWDLYRDSLTSIGSCFLF